jgi:hypothetical protein
MQQHIIDRLHGCTSDDINLSSAKQEVSTAKLAIDFFYVLGNSGNGSPDFESPTRGPGPMCQWPKVKLEDPGAVIAEATTYHEGLLFVQIAKVLPPPPHPHTHLFKMVKESCVLLPAML